MRDGANSGNATSSLKDDFVEGMDIEQAMDLAVTTLLKALDTTSPSADRVDVAVLTLDGDLGSGPVGTASATEVSAADMASASALGTAGGALSIAERRPVHRVLEESEVEAIIERVRDSLVKEGEAASAAT